MHSGFSWVGTGAIADKPVVLRFMEQLKLLSDSDALLADMYFSTWMNQVPYQLETPLVELETRFGFSSVSNGIQRNQLHMVRGPARRITPIATQCALMRWRWQANAARILYDQLKAGTTTFTTVHQQPRWEQRDAKCVPAALWRTTPAQRRLIARLS